MLSLGALIQAIPLFVRKVMSITRFEKEIYYKPYFVRKRFHAFSLGEFSVSILLAVLVLLV